MLKPGPAVSSKGTTGKRRSSCGGSVLPQEDVSMLDERSALFGNNNAVFLRDVVTKVGVSAVDKGSLASGTISKNGTP